MFRNRLHAFLKSKIIIAVDGFFDCFDPIVLNPRWD